MGRWEVATEIRRKETGLSADEVSGDTQRGSERLALRSQETFHVSKTSESLGEGKTLWEASALQSCSVCHIFLFPRLCPACMEARKARFSSGSFLFII